MRVVKQSYEIVYSSPDILKSIEEAGRLCYLSDTAGDAESFIRRLIKNGHESVLEHGMISVVLTCSRSVSHQLVRHRIPSYSQESQRYCNYSKNKFDSEVTFIDPLHYKDKPDLYDMWETSMLCAEGMYMCMLNAGALPEQARGVLPNDTKTVIKVTTNPREWRLIFKLRAEGHADGQMREIMCPMLEEFSTRWPCLFSDLM